MWWLPQKVNDSSHKSRRSQVASHSVGQINALFYFLASSLCTEQCISNSMADCKHNKVRLCLKTQQVTVMEAEKRNENGKGQHDTGQREAGQHDLTLLGALMHSVPVMTVSEVGLTTLKPDSDSTSSPIHCEWQRCQQPGRTGCCVVCWVTLNFLWLCGNLMLSHHRWRKAFKPESGCIQNKSSIAAISLITYK